MPAAYSYLRFSSPAQATGDSVRRQTALRQKWLDDHPDVELDTTLRLTDAGRSAFKRRDAETYAIAQFVEQIKTGRVAAGSYLLLENLDRLSREETGTAVELFLSIANRGVVIVQLSPVVSEFRKPVDLLVLMRAALELSRGNSESKMKSARSEANWSAKQTPTAAETKVVTRKLPGWIAAEGGTGKELKHTAPGEVRLRLNEHADTVRRVFALAIAGHGARIIARTLNTENVPVMGRARVRGRAVVWCATTITHVLQSPAVIGHYVPYVRKHRGTTRTDAPVENYFPPVIDVATYHAAQAATKRRAKVGRGRRAAYVNLFSGLLKDARTGGGIGYHRKSGAASVLVPLDVAHGKAPAGGSFPAVDFETAVLSKLREITAAELMERLRGTPVETITARIAEVDALLAAWEVKMDDVSIVAVVAKKLGELNAKRAELVAELTAAQREAASPLSSAWGDFKSLATLLESDNSDATRLKVQTALRRTIDKVTVLIVNEHRAHQMAVVAVKFTSAHTRLYLIEKRRNQPVKVSSVALSEVAHDLATADGVKFFTKYVKSWAEDGWMQPGVGKPVTVSMMETVAT